ncbi:MAG TPA: response regulator transcription factor [Parvularculaceae bacterium]|nr:response regulator transcription factor [Parvularculaceae bacterium]
MTKPIEEHAPHILVVDDDDRIRSLLKRYLTENGLRVSTAKDGAEARDLMGGVEFDLLILDVMMPGLSGFDLTEKIRAASNVPILLLTARGLPEDRIEGLERGADDYLSKPFEPRELLLRISALLRRSRPTARDRQILTFGDTTFEPGRGELRRDGVEFHQVPDGKHAREQRQKGVGAQIGGLGQPFRLGPEEILQPPGQFRELVFQKSEFREAFERQRARGAGEHRVQMGR